MNAKQKRKLKQNENKAKGKGKGENVENSDAESNEGLEGLSRTNVNSTKKMTQQNKKQKREPAEDSVTSARPLTTSKNGILKQGNPAKKSEIAKGGQSNGNQLRKSVSFPKGPQEHGKGQKKPSTAGKGRKPK